MEKTNKTNSKGVPRNFYSDTYKRAVVAEYERGILDKETLRKRHRIGGNSTILEWCRKYGKLAYPDKGREHKMKDPQQQRIKELEAALELAQFKVLAYEKLIEIAEKEDGISILKKDGAKQLKSLHKRTPAK